MKIEIEYDTKEKVLVVKADGKKMENVNEVSIRKSWGNDDDYCFDVCQVAKDEDNDTRHVTMLSASTHERAKAAIEAGSATEVEEGVVSFTVAGPSVTLSDDVLAYFGGKP